MPRRHADHRRMLLAAEVNSERTAWMEAATGRRRREIGGRAFQSLLLREIADAWQTRNEMRRVGVTGVADHVDGAPLLHQPPRIHDAEAVGNVGVDADIVR